MRVYTFDGADRLAGEKIYYDRATVFGPGWRISSSARPAGAALHIRDSSGNRDSGAGEKYSSPK